MKRATLMNSSEPQADRLQEALDRLTAGEAPAAVWRDLEQGRPEDDLAPLTSLAARLAAVAPATVPPVFRANLQARLQTELAAIRRPRNSRSAWRRLVPRLAGAAMAVVLALGTTVAVSANSLPGEMLYTMKRAAEDVRLALAVTPRLRARVHFDIARARLEEVQALVSRGVAVDAAVIDALIAAHEGLLSAARGAGDPDLMASAAGTLSRAEDGLAILAATAPAGDRAELDQAAADLRRLAESSAATGTSPIAPAERPRVIGPTPALPAAGATDTPALTATSPLPTTAGASGPAAASSPTLALLASPYAPTATATVPAPAVATLPSAPPAGRPSDPVAPPAPGGPVATSEPSRVDPPTPVNPEANARATDLARKTSEPEPTKANTPRPGRPLQPPGPTSEPPPEPTAGDAP